jgi:hypothetical protein
MRWPEFVARVEEQSRLDDSAEVLDIDVVQPSFDQEFDLCALVGQKHRSLWEQVAYTNPPPGWKRHGALVVWKDRGHERTRGGNGCYGWRPTTYEKPKSVVLASDPFKDPKVPELTWIQLRSVVENHPDYDPKMWVNTVDIDACPPDLITLEVSIDWYEPSLIIRGEPAPEPTQQERIGALLRDGNTLQLVKTSK